MILDMIIGYGKDLIEIVILINFMMAIIIDDLIYLVIIDNYEKI